MCFVLLALHQHPDYPLILASNRDEFFNRLAQPLREWDDMRGIIGGRDMLSGGSWLALNYHEQRLALLTNVRNLYDSRCQQTAKRSRGLLVRDSVSSQQSPEQHILAVLAQGDDYAGFNLLAGHFPDALYYVSNRGDAGLTLLKSGFYGLSNASLDTPWPKVVRGKNAFMEQVQRGGEIDTNALYELLADTQVAADTDLPDTGIGLEKERYLSAMFIKASHDLDPLHTYGTRCSSIVLLHKSGHLWFGERTYQPDAYFMDKSFAVSLV